MKELLEIRFNLMLQATEEHLPMAELVFIHTEENRAYNLENGALKSAVTITDSRVTASLKTLKTALATLTHVCERMEVLRDFSDSLNELEQRPDTPETK
jgi:hypothetical protein